MTTTRLRDEFIAIMAREGPPSVPLAVLRKVLRYAATYQRLAEARCNGDWPCDNGERKVEPCHKCEALWVPSTMVQWLHKDKATGATVLGKQCKACRLEVLLRDALKPFDVAPVFGGDPRGACVKLIVPSGRTDDWGGTGICVPA